MGVDTKMIGRVAAIALVGVAITFAALQMREPPAPPSDPATLVPAAAPTDPLVAEMRRCQAIGAEAASDRACIRAWAENRRRFLSPGARPIARLDPSAQSEPATGEDVPADPAGHQTAPSAEAGN